VGAEELFLTAWLIIVALTLATLRLPVAFTALLGLVDVALLVLIGTSHGSAGVTKAGGVVVLAFAAVGIYLFVGTPSTATGGGHATSTGMPWRAPGKRGDHRNGCRIGADTTAMTRHP
jgi:uncharacterized protein